MRPPFISDKSAIIAYGFSDHYLDHLAPLSILWNIPFYTSEENLYRWGKEFYPSLDIHYLEADKFFLFITTHFDTVISCLPRAFIEADFSFTEDLLQKKLFSIWCPHGNSDKGKTIRFMEELQGENLLLIYGQKMTDFLKEKGVSTQVSHVGNYRYFFYQQNKDFYQKKLFKTVLKDLPQAKKTYLYTPTWEDKEGSCSFFSSFESLTTQIPSNINLVIKLHPNTLYQKLDQIERLKGKIAKKKNIFFLDHFPPIYPLLDHCDALIGDASSIGYDFLTFKKPLIFLPGEKPLISDLFPCGLQLTQEDLSIIYEKIEGYLQKSSKETLQLRRSLYHLTFTMKGTSLFP